MKRLLIGAVSIALVADLAVFDWLPLPSLESRFG